MMASCEESFRSCVINIGILLHNKLFKGNGIMKHIIFVFIYLFIKIILKKCHFLFIYSWKTPKYRCFPTHMGTAEGSVQPDQSWQKL